MIHSAIYLTRLQAHDRGRRTDPQHVPSRVGRCIDNAPIESFWGTLKVEMYYLREFQAYNELTSAIEAYISFYNHDRLQKRLNGLRPVEYRAQAA